MRMNGSLHAPQLGCWVRTEDRLPPLGVVVIGVVWGEDGMPATAFLRTDECNCCDGYVWKEGFGEDEVVPPDVWAEARFVIPVCPCGDEDHGLVMVGSDDDEDDEDEDTPPEDDDGES